MNSFCASQIELQTMTVTRRNSTIRSVSGVRDRSTTVGLFVDISFPLVTTSDASKSHDRENSTKVVAEVIRLCHSRTNSDSFSLTCS